MLKPIDPAATVVLLREVNSAIEVLLLRRNPSLVFAGNCWVFPGGRVEPREIDEAGGDLDNANRSAAIRECYEESGITIRRQNLIPISHWTTPEIRTKRFATQFFISLVQGASEAIVDQSEIVECRWLNAAAAITAHRLGQLQVMPPTLVTLSEIAKLPSYDEIFSYYSQREARQYNPRVKVHGKAHASFLYEGDSGYLDTDPEIRDRLNRCEMLDGVIEHHCNLD